MSDLSEPFIKGERVRLRGPAVAEGVVVRGDYNPYKAYPRSLLMDRRVCVDVRITEGAGAGEMGPFSPCELVRIESHFMRCLRAGLENLGAVVQVKAASVGRGRDNLPFWDVLLRHPPEGSIETVRCYIPPGVKHRSPEAVSAVLMEIVGSPTNASLHVFRRGDQMWGCRAEAVDRSVYGDPGPDRLDVIASALRKLSTPVTKEPHAPPAKKSPPRAK